jgi:hypothetical protein
MSVWGVAALLPFCFPEAENRAGDFLFAAGLRGGAFNAAIPHRTWDRPALMYETAADGTFGIEYDDFGRITALPGEYAGGSELTTSYYVNDLTRSQTQGGITNTYGLDATLRQRERTREGGSEEGTQIYHYAGGSDSPSWIEEQGEGEPTWTRSIGALGGSLGALQTSSGEITLQIADIHGDIVGTADIDPEATKLLSTQRFDENGAPPPRSDRPTGSLREEAVDPATVEANTNP